MEVRFGCFSLILIIFNLLTLAHSGVVELGDSDFQSRIKGHNVLVMFYSPQCGHCKALKPTYHSLPELKSIIEENVIIAAVDCTQHHKTCQSNHVEAFPMVKLFPADGTGEIVFDGDREIEEFENFIITNVRPSIIEVLDDDADKFINSTTHPAVMGYFSDAKSKLFIKLQSLAALHKKNFKIGYTFSPQVADSHKQTPESVVIYRQVYLRCPHEQPFSVATEEKELQNFLEKYKLSRVDVRTSKNEHLFKSPLVVAFLPFEIQMRPSFFKRLRNAILKVSNFHPDLSFAISEQNKYSKFLNDLAPSRQETDVILVGYDKDDKKFPAKESGSIDDHKGFEAILSRFVEDFKKGDVLERFIKSQPIPDRDDGFVKTVVARNFDEIVLNPSKDVLIEMYAPWCGHCKKLAPIYEQVAELLKDEENLVIAKMDATANELHPNFPVQGFPTIFFSPANKKNSPQQYTGKRDVASFVEWIKQHATQPIKFSGEIPEPKEEL